MPHQSKFAPLPSLTKLLAAASFVVGASAPLLADAKMSSRDLGDAILSCIPSEFIVSFNNDDDDRNDQEDYRDVLMPLFEDNLRRVTFILPDAEYVTLNEPVLAGTNKSVVHRGRGARPPADKHIRAYQADGRTPFDFNASYKLPVSFYVEGVRPNAKMRDIVMPFIAIGSKGTGLCEGVAHGTVINAEGTFDATRGSGSNFSAHNKMLISADGNGKSSWSPGRHTSEWRYPGAVDGSRLARNQRADRVRRAQIREARRPSNPPVPFTHIAAQISTPRALDTKFYAGTVMTAAGRENQDELVAAMTYQAQTIELHLPVNITAPRHARPLGGWTHGRAIINPNGGWLFPQDGTFSLFNQRVDYAILDQFRDPITESAWDGHKIMVRENIHDVLQSPIPDVNTWIRNNLNHTGTWTSKANGQINDALRARELPRRPTLNRARRAFHTTLQTAGGVLMNLGRGRHEWYVSVDGAPPQATVTQNTFSVTVDAVCDSNRSLCGRARNLGQWNRGIIIRFNSLYAVNTP